MCSQSEYVRCYDARNTSWTEATEVQVMENSEEVREEVGEGVREGVREDVREEVTEEVREDICCLRKNVMSAGIVMSGYKVGEINITNVNNILIFRRIVTLTLSGLTGEENA